MDRTTCLKMVALPQLKRGDTCSEGQYFRNLEPTAVANRYENDVDPPRHGHRLRSPQQWRWTDRDHRNGLSVNLKDCVASPLCPTLLHPDPDRYCAG